MPDSSNPNPNPKVAERAEKASFLSWCATIRVRKAGTSILKILSSPPPVSLLLLVQIQVYLLASVNTQ